MATTVFASEATRDRLAARRAVERTLEPIGQAARQCGDGLPEIGVDWEGAKGLRRLLAHVYHKVDPVIVHRTATEVIPAVLARLQAYLDQEPTPP